MKSEWKLVEASPMEIGLLHNGKPCRTWFISQFRGEKITLEHPLVKVAIRIQRALERSTDK